MSGGRARSRGGDAGAVGGPGREAGEGRGEGSRRGADGAHGFDRHGGRDEPGERDRAVGGDPAVGSGGDSQLFGRGGAEGAAIGASLADLADDPALAEEARRLFAGRVEFLLSAPELRFLPEPDLPEVAFCGRSNVGKSSLLNALTGRRAIARTSVTPGRTQELNVFEVGQPTRFRLVDMPGYGFAKAPLRVVGRWRSLMRSYLRGRNVLRRTLLLVDARHGLKPADREMMELLDESAVGYRIVLTKADKINADALAASRRDAAEEARRHPAAFPQIHATSAAKGLGIAELRTAVLADVKD